MGLSGVGGSLVELAAGFDAGSLSGLVQRDDRRCRRAGGAERPQAAPLLELATKLGTASHRFGVGSW